MCVPLLAVWQDRDETTNLTQKHDVPLIKDQKRCVNLHSRERERKRERER